MNTDLPDHNGEAVTQCKLKFSGVGTGFTGLDVQPIFMELDEVGYFVMKAEAKASPSAERDRKGGLFWMNRLSVDSMAPISPELAKKVLQEYAGQVEKAKAAIDGQTSIDDELDAEAREAADGTDKPAEVAELAAKRIKGGR